MPTTNTDFISKQVAGQPMDSGNKMFWIENTIDTSDLVIVASDVVECLKVLAGWKVLKTNVRVVTAATGSALTANIGDASGANSFDAAIDCKGTAGTEYESAIGTDAYVAGGNGKLYTVDDTIDISWGTVTSVTLNPVLKVRALIQRLNG